MSSSTTTTTSSSSSSSSAAENLRAAQKPLKDKYRSDPASALVTLSSSGSLDPTNLTCSLASSSAAKRVAGLHAAAGGPGADLSSELCSGDMLLESLVACFGVTVRAVATAMGIALKSGTVTAEGDLDFRGTLGVKAEDGKGSVDVGFKAIRLFVRLDMTDDEQDQKTKTTQVEKLISLSERYCVVLQTLRAGVDVTTKLGHLGKPLPDVRPDRELKAEDQGGRKNVGDQEGEPDGPTGGTSMEQAQPGDEPVVADENVLQLN